MYFGRIDFSRSEVWNSIKPSRANLKIYMSKLICGKYTCFENILMQLKYKIYIFPDESRYINIHILLLKI